MERIDVNVKICPVTERHTFLNLVALIYTTGGGVVGAVVTQYVTHIIDRRAARARVIEQIAKAEAAYAALGVSFDIKTIDVSPLARLDEFLGSLEAAALIAGVPRVYLRFYLDSFRFCYECRRLEVTADRLTLGVVKNLPEILKTDESLDPARAREYTQEAIGIAKGLRRVAADEHPDSLRRSALHLLGIAIWHPHIALVLKWKVSKLTRTLDKVDKARQSLMSVNGRLEGKLDLTSYIARQISLLDKPRA